MSSENPDAEQVPIAQPRRYVAGPVVFSVLLHGTLLVLFARTAFAPAEAKLPDASPAIRIALVTRVPPQPASQQSMPEAVPEPPEPEIPNEELTPQGSDTPEETIVPGAEAIAEAGEPASAADAGPSASSPWTPARVRAAIESTAGARQSTATEAWVAGCMLEQKQRGTRDCERQRAEQDYRSSSARAGQEAGESAFAAITRPQQQARVIEQFTRANTTLDPLLDAGGELGALAAQRYYLNRQIIQYLSGNGQDPLFSAMQGFSGDVTGGPRLSLPGNVLFRCKKMPCIYEYNGFAVEQPEPEPQEDEFRVVPSLFGERR